MQAKFLNEGKPYLLSLNILVGPKTFLSGKFHGNGNNRGFIKVWLEYVHPYLEQNGTFTCDQ